MSNYKAQIETVATRILEDWGMMMVEPSENSKNIFASDDQYIVTSVTFKGAMNGSYSILCQQPFVECLVDNLLGGGDNVEEEDKEDALREMANVLCGNLLTECYGDDTVFELGHPQLRAVKDGEVDIFFSDRALCFLADDEPVSISFSLESMNGNH